MPDLTRRDFKLGIGTQLDSQLAYISPNFENKVVSHIVGNYMNNSVFPLYLSIHGKKGEGKTFQTIRVCSKYRLSVYYISSAELCGSYESDSISNIQENLSRALHELKSEQVMSVFIIDDFHLSIASTEIGVGRTVNSQVLTAFLMNLSDKAKASKNMRIPFILLGNDFTNLYDPLTRDGRMDFFEWNPAQKEKIKMVCFHFDDLLPTSEDKEALTKIVETYNTQPISFFAEIKNDLFKSVVSEYIRHCSQSDIRKIIAHLNSERRMCCSDILPQIERLATERITNSKMILHEERGNLHHV